MKKQKLEFYAFFYDWNSKSLIRTNVLSMFEDKKEVKKTIKFWKVTNREQFKERVRISLMSRFWSKREYEIAVFDLYPRVEDLDTGIKIDVWYQLEPNLDIIVDLIIKYHNLEF